MTKIKGNEIDLYFSIVREFKGDINDYIDNKLLNIETDIDVLKNLLEIDSLTRLSFYKEPNNSLRYKLSPIRTSLLDKYDKREEDTIMNSLRDSKNLFESKDRNSIEYWDRMSNKINEYISNISNIHNITNEYNKLQENNNFDFINTIIQIINRLQDWYSINLFLKEKNAGSIDEYRNNKVYNSYNCTVRYTLKDEDDIDCGVGVMFGFDNDGNIIKCSLGTKHINTNYDYYLKNVTQVLNDKLEALVAIIFDALLWYSLKHLNLSYNNCRNICVEMLLNAINNTEPKYSNNHKALVSLQFKDNYNNLITKEYELASLYRE